MIITLAGTLLTFMLIVYLISTIKSTRSVSKAESEEQLIQINMEILAKQEQLESITQQITNQTINKSVSLSNIEIQVLDIYDRSNIKIPVDIIEDLSSMKLGNEKDIIDYIENQRLFWKLENTKKPYKRSL